MQEQNFVSRLRLVFWTVLLIFVLHALPGQFFPEIYPITRWAMYSEQAFYPADSVAKQSVRVQLSDCSWHTLQPRMILDGTGIGAYVWLKVGYAMFDETHPENESVRNQITARVQETFGQDPIEFQQVYNVHTVQLDTSPFLSTEPISTEVAKAFTVGDDSSECMGDNDEYQED